MKISVTQDDIDNGTPENCLLCPVSLAMQRAGLPITELAEVLGSPHPPIPYSVFTFFESFDWGETVYPFEFEYDPNKIDPQRTPANDSTTPTSPSLTSSTSER